MRAIVMLLLAAFLQTLPIGSVGPFSGGGGSGTWTLVQYKNHSSTGQGTGGGTCTVATCSMTITAPAAGDLIVITGGMSYSSAITLNTPTVTGQTFTHCPNSGGQSSSGWLDCWYELSSAANATTTATCVPSNTGGAYLACAYWEYHWSGTSVTLDNAPAVGTDASCTSCAGVAVTAAGTDVVLQLGLPANSITAISDATYSNPANYFGTDDFGNAGKLNASGTLTTPNWTQSPTGTATVMGLSFEGH